MPKTLCSRQTHIQEWGIAEWVYDDLSATTHEFTKSMPGQRRYYPAGKRWEIIQNMAEL